MLSMFRKSAPVDDKSTTDRTPESIKMFTAETMRAMSQGKRFTVFLCGPYLDFNENGFIRKISKIASVWVSFFQKKNSDGTVLRKKIKDRLEEDGFEVMLGEDNGLEKLRGTYNGNAQDNELDFIKSQCNAIVIVASSVGSFCELGLFSWHFVHSGAGGIIEKNLLPAFIVLAEKQYDPEITGSSSYFHEGPIEALRGNGGYAFYVNFKKCEEDIDTVVKYLRSARAVHVSNKRGPWAGGRK